MASAQKILTLAVKRCVQGTRTKVISFVTNEQLKNKVKKFVFCCCFIRCYVFLLFLYCCRNEETHGSHHHLRDLCLLLFDIHTHIDEARDKWNENGIVVLFISREKKTKMNKWNYVWNKKSENRREKRQIKKEMMEKMHANEYQKWTIFRNFCCCCWADEMWRERVIRQNKQTWALLYDSWKFRWR